MEIVEIKSRLSILAVANQLGIQVNKYRKALCPFHDDKRPSLQFSEDKQICTCFSSACSAGTMDTISLVEKKLNVNTHEAIKWLQEEFNLTESTPQKAEPVKTEVNYAKLFKVFEGNFKKSEKAQNYLKGRSINPASLEVGLNSTAWPQMKYCVIFPLKDKDDKIVSLYGRSIINDKENKHYYTKERTGVYPRWPRSWTQTLVITESVIDAATLEQLRFNIENLFTDGTQILACYGTNGFTPDHEQAVKELKHLEEIIIFFDGDKAGREGAKKLLEKLQSITNVKLSMVNCPEGEDINSLLQSHEAEIFHHLIKSRAPFSFSSEQLTESATQTTSTEQTPSPSERAGVRLHTSNPELLFYENGVLNVTVLGGIKITGLDRLRVTLKVENKNHTHLLPLRHNLDLYNKGQVDQLCTQAAQTLDISTPEAIHAMAGLTAALEQYRNTRLEALKPKKEDKRIMSEADKREALEYLKGKELMKRTLQDIISTGIVGEKLNCMIAWLTYTSRKREKPLHLMCLGASGVGKTYLQEKIGQLIPEEDKLEITTLSENAFYYFGQEELKHKLILIEDLDGAENVLYPLRELQSKTSISKTVTLKDNKGNLKTITLKVEGPVSVSSCTTREKLYEDNANRCILIYIDTSAEQDKRIMEHQQRASAGMINHSEENKIKERLKNVQRLLRPVTVRNPYAQYINLPEAVFKPRRTMLLLLSFIETITFYHQYQRESKVDTQTGEHYIESTVQDIEYAFKLLKEVLFSKSDELTGACRKFFEQLKLHLKKEKKESFYSAAIRKALRMNPNNLKRYLMELSRYSYLKINGGNKFKGYEYQIANEQEYEQLKSDIDQKLDLILQSIKGVSGSVGQ
jgi:DNA primase